MQRGVAKGLKVPCLFMITEVSIRCQKNPEVGIRRIYRRIPPQYTTDYAPEPARGCEGGAENASTGKRKYGKSKYETAHFARMENTCTENASTMQTFSQIKKVWYFTS